MLEYIQKTLESKAKVWAIVMVWCLLISNLIVPRHWGFYGEGDWDLTYSTFELARKSIVEYHQWPSYQPFLAFGSDMDANPQSVFVSVYFIPVLVLGTFYGLKLSVFMAMLIGFWGFYRLFNRIQTDQIISVSVALISVSAAYFSRHIWEAGHSNFLHAYWIPWCLYWFDVFRTSGKLSSWIKGTCMLAMPIAGGAPILFLMMSLLILLWSIGLIWCKTVKFKWFIYMMAAGITTLLLNAWKLLPVLDQWQTQARLVTDDSSISPMVWLCAWMDYPIDSKTPHQWHEISIGFPLVLMVIAGVYLKQIKHYKKWLILALPIVWLNLGNFPAYVNPWYVLHHFIGIFDGIRAPYRIGLLTLIIGAVFAVLALSKISDKKLIYIVLITFTLTQGLNYFSISNRLVFSPRIDAVESKSGLHQVIKLKAQNTGMFDQVKAENFVVNAYEPLHLNKVSDTLNTFIQGGKLTHFTPQQIAFEANDSNTTFNLRYNAYWQLKGHGKLVNHKGLLCVKQASGNAQILYHNPYTKTGAIITLITGILLLLLWSVRIRNISLQLAAEGITEGLISLV